MKIKSPCVMGGGWRPITRGKDGSVAIRKRTNKLIVEEEGVVEAAKGEAAERWERKREGGRERWRVETRKIPGNNTK